MKLTLLTALLAGSLSAADLTLLDGGKSDYQIVVPTKLETSALTDCLAQTARLLQVAFKANGAEVLVVSETERDASKPALLLGSTRFAQEHGVAQRRTVGQLLFQPRRQRRQSASEPPRRTPDRHLSGPHPI